MSNILIGYEYGLGMGHLARILPISRILSVHNHRVIFFVYNPQECVQTLVKEKIPIIAVMNIRSNIPEMRNQPRYNSYSDFMAMAGGYHLEHLYAITLSWKTIFDLYKPDLIICDHSPNCCLAAFGRIPVVLLGDGFTLPPAYEPFFPVISGVANIVDPDRVLENMRIVQKMHGHRIPQTITEPFRTAARLFCTLPELDHYLLMRRDKVIGPPPNDLFEPIITPTEPRWFAYLKANFQITSKILENLCTVKIPGEVYINDLTHEGEERLTLNNIIVHRSPPPMNQILPRVSVVLHHGGNGLSCAALSAGRPQIVVPMYHEAELTGGFLQRTGAGHMLFPKDAQSTDVGSLISEVVKSEEMMCRAQAVARNIYDRGPSCYIETCIETCEKILAG